jgi:hypothetical protein
MAVPGRRMYDRRMRTTRVLGAGLVIVSASCVWLALPIAPRVPPVPVPVLDPAQSVEQPAPTPANRQPPPSDAPRRVAPSAGIVPRPAPLRRLRIPPDLSDFEDWPHERQVSAVTDLQRHASLSSAMRDFLVDLASDPARPSLLRNNAANALGIQDPPVPGWLAALAEQALDPDETATWRDYALQHLADQVGRHADRATAEPGFVGHSDSGLDLRRYIAVLTAVASGRELVAGTAMLHLDRLDREHGVRIDGMSFHALILRMLDDETVDAGARVTAMGILGLRGESADAAVARRYLTHPDVELRRASIAALGVLGTSDDIAAIIAVDAAGDLALAAAKAAAFRRLRAQGSQRADP